ncbi:MAG: hypothetical protein A2219_00275 [Elusimicrobia bacterium RIFOXYA2_FULL_50_26]|nr:MAG: hypothetical protein A2219_00275 [Elusimicrobia bacterium RIFOXYA2_FULL_50_26]OGS22506.1 MAG: hypothetical protein A2314_08395 [Elusimicrobia bacterium RIFOXYB2_FULL_50_12]
MKKNTNTGFIRIAFAALLVLFGALVCLFWYGVSENYLTASAELNGNVTDILISNGLTDRNITEQYQKERRAGTTVWIEHFRKLKLPAKVKAVVVAEQIRALAAKNQLNVAITAADGGETTVSVTKGNMLFLKVTLISPAAAKVKKAKRAAIVIDDAGTMSDISAFLDLGVPLTFAILPAEHFSRKTASTLSARHMPYLMHLPLEPEGYPKVNPGKAALLTGMNSADLKKKFEANLATVPGISGVSNHMGSRFSADANKMKALLGLVKEKGLFYFDSYTTPKSAARAAARAVGLVELENEIFLDNEDSPDYIRAQLDRLFKRAGRRGTAIAIGHVHKKHLAAAIRENMPRFKNAGIEFVYLTDLVDRKENK